MLTEEQAVRVVTAAFNEGWPDKEVVPYPDLNAPYSIKLRFALDREHIIVIPNTLGSQTTFSVINRGTAPVVGVPARKELVELINKHAANMSGSWEWQVADGEELAERSDRKWILASLSNCYLAVGNDKEANVYEERFLAEELADWEQKAFFEAKLMLKKHLKSFGIWESNWIIFSILLT